MILEHYFSILPTSFFNKILSKVVLVSLKYTIKFQVNPLSIKDLAVLCSKGPPARKRPVFDCSGENGRFRCFEEHVFAVTKQSYPCKTVHAVQTRGHHGACKEVQRQKTRFKSPDRQTCRGLRLQFKLDLADRSDIPGPKFWVRTLWLPSPPSGQPREAS